MSKIFGRKQSWGWGKEGTGENRGVAVVPTLWLALETKAFNPEIIRKDVDTNYGRVEGSIGVDILAKRSRPRLGGYLVEKAPGDLLTAILGTSTPTLLESGVWSHAVSVVNTEVRPSYTISIDDGTIEKCAALCVLDELTLDFLIEDYVKFDAKWIGKAPATAATLTPGLVREKVFKCKHITMKIAANVAGLGAASAWEVSRAKLTIKNNAEPDMKLGDEEPRDVEAKKLEISLEVERPQEDWAYVDLEAINTTKAIQISVVSDEKIGSSNFPTMTIILAAVTVETVAQDNSNADYVKETITFKGHYSLAEGETKSIEATVIDTVSSH